MERQPLFYVGEEIILSEDNKIYIVDQVIKGGDPFLIVSSNIKEFPKEKFLRLSAERILPL